MGDDAQFGDLLRYHRVAAGLTQGALAELAGLSLRGVSDLERGLRTAPHRDTLQRLLDALHLGELEREAMQNAARHHRRIGPNENSRPSIGTAALPVMLSSFVGRQHELAEVEPRLARTRLLTLTGPGGSGKTRLAMQIGFDHTAAFADGVVFVPLAPISDPELVASTIAQALGIRDLGGRSMLHRLNEYLQSRSVLLVLDNFEQVLSAAPLVSGILAAAREVKVLVTSREPLRVQGEHEYEVPPLALPLPGEHYSIEALSQYGAVALFVDRATEINPDFELTTGNAADVVEICRRLDGLPLAIELAAPWMRVLHPYKLRERLAQRLMLLTDGPRDLPARQQTLRATIAWSYDLLEPTEQVLFRRLSIFVGGCTLEAAEAVAGDDQLNMDVLVGVRSLVAKSLVRRQEGPTGQVRLGMLETIREYGLEQLHASGDLDSIRRRHASFYLALAEEAELSLLGAEQVRWARQLEMDYDNLRAVMAWSRDGSIDDEIGVRLAGALAWFWVLSGVAWEARAWVEAMLALPSARAPTRARARALHAGARVAIVQGDPAASTGARGFAHESAEIFQAIGDEAGLGRALSALGSAYCVHGEYTSARVSLEQSIVLAQNVGDRAGLAFALGQLGNVLEHDGEYDAARRPREKAVAVAREIGDRHSLGIALAALAYQARLHGNLAEATAHLHECLRLGTELGPSWRVLPRALAGLAGLASLQGDHLRSARLFGAAESLWDASGKWDMPWWRAVFDADTAIVRRVLGDQSFAERFGEGRAMRLEEVLAYALDQPRAHGYR